MDGEIVFKGSEKELVRISPGSGVVEREVKVVGSQGSFSLLGLWLLAMLLNFLIVYGIHGTIIALSSSFFLFYLILPIGLGCLMGIFTHGLSVFILIPILIYLITSLIWGLPAMLLGFKLDAEEFVVLLLLNLAPPLLILICYWEELLDYDLKIEKD